MAMNDPIFRAPKGTANFNAFRTLAVGVFGVLALLVLTDPVLRFWDGTLRQIPWISSKIAIRPAAPPFGAVVSDTTSASWPVTGIRRVWVEDEHGQRICNTQRHDSWQGETGSTWTFVAFTGGCQIPDHPFRVCSKFLVETPRTVPGVFGPFCSDLFKPEAGHAD